MNYLGDTKLGFGYTLNSFLDHIALLNWINYMAHRCRIGETNKNLDGREYVVLPSGKKVIIKITIEEYVDVQG